MRKILAGLMLFAPFAGAQTAPAGQVVGVGNFIHDVADLDKSVEFYHDVIGMDLQGTPPPAGTSRPFNSATEVPRLYHAVGAQFRVTSAIVQGSPMRAELVEFKGVDRKPVSPRIQDPGASIFVITIRDLRPIMIQIKKHDVHVVTSGGQPVTLDDKSRAIVLKDPDGFYVELVERRNFSTTDASADTNPIDAAFWFTVSDIAPMLKVFKDTLGFDLKTSPYTSDKNEAKLFGVKGAQIRRSTALVPGTSFEVTFLEFKGVEREPVHSRPQDPGSAVLRLLVGDIDYTVKALDEAGVKVASEGGGPVTLPAGPGNTIRAAITSAPDNLYVQVLAAPRK